MINSRQARYRYSAISTVLPFFYPLMKRDNFIENYIIQQALQWIDICSRLATSPN